MPKQDGSQRKNKERCEYARLDETVFYKWTAGVLGDYPLSEAIAVNRNEY